MKTLFLHNISFFAQTIFFSCAFWGIALSVEAKNQDNADSFKRPNTFIIRSIQAGSTTDIDNVTVTDLDTQKVVYNNTFSNVSDATRDLILHYYPTSYKEGNNHQTNSKMTRVVNGKLRLETTGFNKNGRGGYDSVSDATYTGELPHNFMVEFDAQRMQWAGHFRIFAVYKNKGDTSANLAPSPDSFKGNQVKLAMYGEGSWFNSPTISITGKKSPFSFAKPSGNPTKNHRYGMSIKGTTVNFYIDGKSIGTADLSDYLKEEKPKDKIDLNDGLVAWYPLDGNASDMSSNAFDGTVYGAMPTKNRHGVISSAYKFDGQDDYIRINHSADLNTLPLSISVWFNSGGNPLETGIVSKYSSGHWNGWQIMEQDGNIVPWYLRSGNPKNVIIGRYGENKVFETKFEKNNWNQAVSVFSKDGGFLYLNGRLMDQKDWTGSAGQVTTTQHLDIGLYKQTSGRGFFSGLIDDIRIYNRALSDDDVALLYEYESNDSSDDHDTPPPPPTNDPGTPPDQDYKKTIAELKRLLAEKDKKLAHCEKEMDAKKKEIGKLTSENAKLQGEVKSLNGKVKGLEKEVATLKSDNEGLKAQVQNLREENQNLNYELTTTKEYLKEAIRVAETPFINGWVYDPVRGWLFTDAEHFPLVFTHNDQSWNYYELGSSDPRYFYNYTTQEWAAWDAEPSQAEQLVARN